MSDCSVPSFTWIARIPNTTDNHCAKHLVNYRVLGQIWHSYLASCRTSLSLLRSSETSCRTCPGTFLRCLSPEGCFHHRSREIPRRSGTRSPRSGSDPGSRSRLWFQLSDAETPSQGLSRQCSCRRASASRRETQHQGQEQDQVPDGKPQHLATVWAQRD